MAWFGACLTALCVHAHALADGGTVQSTSTAHSGRELEMFVQLFLAGFIANLVVQSLAAMRRLRSDFKAAGQR